MSQTAPSGGALARLLVVLLACGWVAAGHAAPPARAQVTVPTEPPPSTTSTTRPPATTSPPRTTAAPQPTMAPAPASVVPLVTTTQRRTTTTTPASTTTGVTTTVAPAVQEPAPLLAPGNTQPLDDPTTVPTTPLGGDATVSPLFPALSVAGFVIALGLLAARWLLTRPGQPPGRGL